MRQRGQEDVVSDVGILLNLLKKKTYCLFIILHFMKDNLVGLNGYLD